MLWACHEERGKSYCDKKSVSMICFIEKMDCVMDDMGKSESEYDIYE